jgi:hypothetical protein
VWFLSFCGLRGARVRNPSRQPALFGEQECMVH